MDEMWALFKPILEVGSVGAMAVLMFLIFMKKDKKLEACLRELVATERQHGKDLLVKEAENNRNLAEVIRQYEGSTAGMNMTMSHLVDALHSSRKGVDHGEPPVGN